MREIAVITQKAVLKFVKSKRPEQGFYTTSI